MSLLITLLASLCFGSSVQDEDGGVLRVELKEQAQVSTRQVRLEDVAEIHGPKEAVESLRGLSLGDAPSVGLTRTISRTGILLAARRSGIGFAKDRFEGASEVEVSARYKPMPKDELVAAALQFVEKELGEDRSRVQIEVTSVPEQPVKVLGTGRATTYHPEWFGTPREHGVVQVRVVLRQEEDEVGSAVVGFDLRRFGGAMRLLRDLAAGETPTAEDVSFTEVPLADILGTPVTDHGQMVGAVARRALKSGEILLVEDFEKPVLVHKGDPVTLVLRRGSLEVQVECIATGTGRAGDVVRVLNPVSRRDVMAQLIGRSPLGGAIARVR